MKLILFVISTFQRSYMGNRKLSTSRFYNLLSLKILKLIDFIGNNE